MLLDCVYTAGKTICCCETDGRTTCKFKTAPGERGNQLMTEMIRSIAAADPAKFRTHTTGASRDLDDGKPDFEAMLSPLVMEAYGAYMTRKRRMADGTLREADNWQKGMPLEWFIKSGWRHMVDWWKHHRKEGVTTEMVEDTLCALLFNASGYLHEHLKAQRK